jgi:glucoside 3-dehydrogenase (cytochrome c) hitch-hiker subunit
MDRRHLLQLLGAAATLPFVPRDAEAALAFGGRAHASAAGRPLQVLTPDQDAVVTLVAEMIIPRTDTPGATDVEVTRFIDLLLAEWYPDEEREQYLAGLADLDRRARESRGSGFVDLDEAARAGLLASLDQADGPAGGAERFFTRTKSLTIYGYFTSQRVMEDVLRTPVIPGRFDGCVPLTARTEE